MNKDIFVQSTFWYQIAIKKKDFQDKEKMQEACQM